MIVNSSNSVMGNSRERSSQTSGTDCGQNGLIRDEERRQKEREEEAERRRKEQEKTRASGGIPTKARPTSPPPPPARIHDWGGIKVGPTASVRAISVTDYTGAFVRCELLKSGDSFLPFNLEGVVAMTPSAKRPWLQYLRRVTHYSSLVMGTTSNTYLQGLDDADNVSWLKMYTHNFNATCLKTSNVFLSPEALMIRLDMCTMTETAGEIPNLAKRLSSKVGTHEIGCPTQVDADQALCGALRAASTVVITDLTYHTCSRANKYNVEAGLQNLMNNADTKVFQVDWGKMRDAQSTITIFENALGHITNIIRNGGQPP